MKLYEIERRMIFAKANGQKIRFWWYKRKYLKLRKKEMNK